MNNIKNEPAPAILRLNGVVFTGRSAGEYENMFALKISELAGKAVLDCPGGCSSFTKEARIAGATAIAIDPVYSFGKNRIDSSYIKGVEESEPLILDALAALKEGRPSWADPQIFFSNYHELLQLHEKAYLDFISSYTSELNSGVYLTSSLPKLGSDFENKFDLVLCANFLFAYPEILNYAFHIESIQKLILCCNPGGEVRIYPVRGLDGEWYPEISQLRAELASSGIATEIVDVPYRFIKNWHEMLVAKRIAT